MTQYWHRFSGRPEKIILGESRCELCGIVATQDNITTPIKEGGEGFLKHAHPTPLHADKDS